MISKKYHKNIKKLIYVVLPILTLYIFQLIINLGDLLLHVSIYNVGQGDSILITTPNKKRMLIDGGPNEGILEHLSDEFGILPCKLDLVVISHPHADHVSGLLSVIERCKVIKIASNFIDYDSEEYKLLMSKVKGQGIKVIPLVSGNKILSDEIAVEVLWPEKSYIKEGNYATNVNNTSVVLLIDYKNFEIILTGDAESEVQERFLINDDIEVIKVPHQGAFDGLNEEFLEKVKPDLAVISVGKNKYGHPDPKVLGAYNKRGIEVLRTDEVGSVEIVSDGSKYWANTNN